MPRDFQLELDKLTAQLTALREEMAQISETIIAEAGTVVANWSKSYSVELVKKEPEVTTSLGRDGVAKVKQAVEDFATRAPGNVRTALSSESVWYHIDLKEPTSKNGYYPPYERINSDLPEPIRKPLRYAMGQLGQLLQAFGYLRGSQRMTGLNGWRRLPEDEYGGRPYFPGEIPDVDALHSAIKEYRAKFEVAKSVKARHAQVEREKVAAEAQDLWDSV